LRSWWDSIVRAVVSALAGIGTACVTSHLTHRPNAAFFVSVLATGISIAFLNRQSRTDSDTTPRGGLTSEPKPDLSPMQGDRKKVERPTADETTYVGDAPQAPGPASDPAITRNTQSPAAPVPLSASALNNVAASDEAEPHTPEPHLSMEDTPAVAPRIAHASVAQPPSAQTSPLPIETVIADYAPSPQALPMRATGNSGTLLSHRIDNDDESAAECTPLLPV